MHSKSKSQYTGAVSPTTDWRLCAALSASQMGLWDWDLQSNAVTWSPETFEIVGMEHFDGCFDSFAKLVHPDDLARVLDTVDRALRQKSGYTDEFRIIRPDGVERWLCNVGRPTFDETGAPLRLSGTVQDVTERKKDEQILKCYAQRLMVLEEELRKKLSIDLHDDIGQDIAALSFNLSYIRKCLPFQASENLRSTLDNSSRLTKEINRAVRELMVKLHPVQLEEYGLAGAIADHARRFAKKTGLAITLQLSPVLPRLAVHTELALFRITQEALNNIFKHAAATKVEISLDSNDGPLHLRIMDNGRGFVPQDASLQPTGTRWGITIMRQRAELAGGSFRIQTGIGAGTTIAVEIKLAEGNDTLPSNAPK